MPGWDVIGSPLRFRAWRSADVTLAAMVALNVWGKGLARMLCALIGMIAGYVAAGAAGPGFGRRAEGQRSEVSVVRCHPVKARMRTPLRCRSRDNGGSRRAPRRRCRRPA